MINNSMGKDHIVNNSLYYKYNILKISDINNVELSKFMYNHDVKALSEIFETYFLPLQMLIVTINTNSGRNSKQFNDVRK